MDLGRKEGIRGSKRPLVREEHPEFYPEEYTTQEQDFQESTPLAEEYDGEIILRQMMDIGVSFALCTGA